MANLQINMPDDLCERLRRVVGADDSSVSDFIMAVTLREVEWLEWKERWANLSVSERTVNMATALEESRAEVDAGENRRELTMTEWQARRRNRPVLDLDFDAAAAIREERQRREQEWDRHMKSRQKNTS